MMKRTIEQNHKESEYHLLSLPYDIISLILGFITPFAFLLPLCFVCKKIYGEGSQYHSVVKELLEKSRAEYFVEYYGRVIQPIISRNLEENVGNKNILCINNCIFYAECGNINLTTWLMKCCKNPLSPLCFAVAAKHGQEEFIRHFHGIAKDELKNTFHGLRKHNIDWDFSTGYEAAGSGYIQILEYFMDNSVKLNWISDNADSMTSDDSLRITRLTQEKHTFWRNCYLEAIENKRLNVLKWLHKKKATTQVNEYYKEYLLEDYVEKEEPTITDPLCIEIGKSGSIEITEWFMEMGYDLDTYYLIRGSCAAPTSDLLKWLLEKFQNVFPINSRVNKQNHIDFDTFIDRYNDTFFLYSDSIEKFQILISYGCQWHASTSIVLAHLGNFETFKWAIEQGCPVNLQNVDCEHTWERRNRGGYKKIYEYLKERGCKCKFHTGVMDTYYSMETDSYSSDKEQEQNKEIHIYISE